MDIKPPSSNYGLPNDNLQPPSSGGQGPTPSIPPLPVPLIPEDGGPYVSTPTKRETAREIFSTIGVLVAALFVAFGLIAWVFQSYEVDGPSMETTLQNRDRLIVWKVPRTVSKISGTPWIPNRGDVIIFNEGGLSQFGSTDTKQLIKRVIALPGERITVRDGEITVYNQKHPDGFNPDETMSYGKRINEDFSASDIDLTLEENQVFVSGDNRPNSLDSRTFGPVEADQIVGKLSLRLLPVSNIERF